MSRSCARPGCSHQAVATMSYAYADGVVWIEVLAAEAHPMVHDLCASHAATVGVPRGWELRDTWSSAARPDVTSGAAHHHAGGNGHLDLIGA